MIGRLKRLKPRGQAMLEYSVVSYVLLVGFLGTVGIGWPFVSKMFSGLSVYYKSIYFVLTSPVP